MKDSKKLIKTVFLIKDITAQVFFDVMSKREVKFVEDSQETPISFDTYEAAENLKNELPDGVYKIEKVTMISTK